MAVISQLLDNPYALQGLLIAAAFVILSALYKDLTHGIPYKDIPIVGRGLWELSNKKAKNRFMTSARDLITQGFEQVRIASMGQSAQAGMGVETDRPPAGKNHVSVYGIVQSDDCPPSPVYQRN